jgi:nitrogen-specific signal transduction histidine kinase
MPVRPPFLAIPIKALCDPDGHLLSADPQLRRLHDESGGVEGGILAVPKLLELVQLSATTGIRVERLVHVADRTHDVDLWVEAHPGVDGIKLSILGWHEHLWAPGTVAEQANTAANPYRMATRTALSIAPNGLVIRATASIRSLFGGVVQGRRIEDLLQLKSTELSWTDLLAQCETIGPLPVLTTNGTALLFSADPAINEGGNVVGFHARFAEASTLSTLESDPAVTTGGSGLGFGRQFASAVRQPLSRIMANAQTIGSRLNGHIDESYAGYAQDIATAARHLSELVGDLEDLDAIDRADFNVASEQVELGDIARRVGGLLALKAADHHIELILPPVDLKVPVIGEFRRILQIVLNLVGNAIRYAPDGSVVTVSIDPATSSLAVSDQGQGIKEEDRQRVFEKFERLGRSGDGGSGLGLYISRRLARAMHGELVIGESPEGGAMFTLSLPKANLI